MAPRRVWLFNSSPSMTPMTARMHWSLLLWYTLRATSMYVVQHPGVILAVVGNETRKAPYHKYPHSVVRTSGHGQYKPRDNSSLHNTHSTGHLSACLPACAKWQTASPSTLCRPAIAILRLYVSYRMYCTLLIVMVAPDPPHWRGANVPRCTHPFISPTFLGLLRSKTLTCQPCELSWLPPCHWRRLPAGG